MLNIGDTYLHEFVITQAQVNAFAEISGDNNPLHLDEKFAATTPFKKPIMHGFLGGSVFSKVLGTIFPGNGTVYLKQNLNFLRPMFVENKYEARFKILEIDTKKNTAIIETQVFDKETGKQVISGEASVMNKEKFV